MVRRQRRVRAARAPHVVGRAPLAGVGIVDELERNQPWVEGVVGQGQPQAPVYDRFAVEAPLVTVERLGDVDQRVVELVVARPHHRIRFGERREDGPDRLHVWCPLATEVGLPAAVVQHRPRQAVDQHRDDLVGRRARAVAADRGCDGGGMGERVAVGVAQHRPPSGDGERSLVEHLGRYAPAADNVHREPGERREPGQRRRQALATRGVGQPHRGTERIELHRRHRAAVAAR